VAVLLHAARTLEPAKPATEPAKPATAPPHYVSLLHQHRAHTSAYVSIRQHTSACVSIRQHTSAYVSIRQHTSACVSRRQHTSAYVSIRQHMSAYVSTRQHTSACVSLTVAQAPSLPTKKKINSDVRRGLVGHTVCRTYIENAGYSPSFLAGFSRSHVVK
jgi:hypothetical protein